MDSLATAEGLAERGQYRAALKVLSDSGPNRLGQATLLRAELLEITGDTERAHAVIQQIFHSENLTESEQSRAEFILSRLSAEQGNFDAELRHLQKAITLAERVHDLKRACLAQLRLLALIADRSGLHSVGSLLSVLRAKATKLGDAAVTAALHVFVAELDGKRGSIESGIRHTRLAQQILTSHPHLGLEAWAHNNLLAFAILRGDIDQALSHGSLALSSSVECGSAAILRRCLSNLGRVHLARGQCDEALEHFNRAISYASSSNEHVNGTLDSIARVLLLQGKLQEGLELVARVDASTQQPNGAGRYVHRHSLLTKAEFLLRMRRWEESVACIDQILVLAAQASDVVLIASANLLRAEVLLYLGLHGKAQDLVASVVPHLPTLPLDIYGQYERTVACALTAAGQAEAGRFHMQRSERIYAGLHDMPALAQLSLSWKTAAERWNGESPVGSVRRAAQLLHSIAALMMQAGRPELVATNLVAILEDTQAVSGAVAIARNEQGHEETLAAFGTPPAKASSDVPTLPLGTSRQRLIEIRLQPLRDLEAQATLNSITLLLAAVQELERAQAARDEQLAIWPADELPSEDETSVIDGAMRTLMSYAKRIAQTNISVLITGESGTGKEVLARAIHSHSARAKKPFVPINCTAVPRELLESHLFGHRRGAFTGADRDNQGLIRAAKDGTLFLDEVGELGLDLQPKLLRFLESGEIHPLGETSPFRVDVRIVSATNADIEQLVQEGRFREDLFYRLNVIRLSIPPLRERRDEIPGLVHHFVAQAAKEFGKHRIRVAEETMEHLLLYQWPGNIRQLQNELRRMVALAEPDAVLTPALLAKSIQHGTKHAMRSGSGLELAVPLTEKLNPTLSRIEREMIKVALRASHGRVDAAAKALGISRKGLYLKRQRLGL